MSGLSPRAGEPVPPPWRATHRAADCIHPTCCLLPLCTCLPGLEPGLCIDEKRHEGAQDSESDNLVQIWHWWERQREDHGWMANGKWLVEPGFLSGCSSLTCLLPATWSRMSYFISLCLGLLMCKMGMIILAPCYGAAVRVFLVPQMVKNLPAIQETWVRSLGREDPLEKGMATHSSVLACRIPWTEGSGGLLLCCEESDTTEAT